MPHFYQAGGSETDGLQVIAIENHRQHGQDDKLKMEQPEWLFIN
jgi:hypothetical protein